MKSEEKAPSTHFIRRPEFIDGETLALSTHVAHTPNNFRISLTLPFKLLLRFRRRTSRNCPSVRYQTWENIMLRRDRLGEGG